MGRIPTSRLTNTEYAHYSAKGVLLFFFDFDHISTKKGGLLLLLQPFSIVPAIFLIIFTNRIPSYLLPLYLSDNTNEAMAILKTMHAAFWCLFAAAAIIVAGTALYQWLIIRKMDREDLCSLRFPKTIGITFTMISLGISVSFLGLETVPGWIKSVRQDIEQITAGQLNILDVTFDVGKRQKRGMISGPYYSNSAHIVDSYFVMLTTSRGISLTVPKQLEAYRKILPDIEGGAKITRRVKYTNHFNIVADIENVAGSTSE